MKISIFLAIGCSLVALMCGVGIGYYATPEYKTTMFDKNSMSLGRADRTLDLRYINAMIAHHRGAMLLAEQALKQASRQEMKGLASAILADEPKAIEALYTWKNEWYGDTRVVRDPVVANLGSSNETFDLRFLNALIAHHEAGILMTKEVRQKSSRAEVLDNADAVEAFLTNGIFMLKEYRKNWFGV